MWQDSAVSFQAPPLSSTTQLPKDSAQQELGRHSKYCHFCQHVKSTMAACSSPQCTFKFCHNCISVHLMEDWDAVLRAERDKSWKCPCCRYRCCCCSSKACTAKHPHCKAYRKRQQTRVNVVEGGE
ncbi:hypothetical protein GUITHDRAFT_152159 [Guillardia theta CCMP2712]|uniref:Zinc-finger domain-containing protein n=2 Tax=Guillardia theta TaxID=55529 RepID=L1JG27_GUITC|nr:hypothetical protein GUITHDRAFT_152159 [Guillardia theta CCMP2712]EKX47099.1 hypothetical protein GUITHDRAFT_152159 [Guillardia theta CCMP2712]|eukprot:XP_005834079.1 hypothetical protein GUITHDRAFT_152159 [Guillardia theta CCMP2712]